MLTTKNYFLRRAQATRPTKRCNLQFFQNKLNLFQRTNSIYIKHKTNQTNNSTQTKTKLFFDQNSYKYYIYYYVFILILLILNLLILNIYIRKQLTSHKNRDRFYVQKRQRFYRFLAEQTVPLY